MAFRLVLILGLGAASCRHADEPAAEVPSSLPSTAHESPILIDLRWGDKSGGGYAHRTTWVFGGDYASFGHWQPFEADSSTKPDDAASQLAARCDELCAKAFALSEEAFDRLRLVSGGAIPADEYVVKSGRKYHLVLPDCELTRVVVLDFNEVGRGLIELPSLRQVALPVALDTLVPVACWSADGSVIATASDQHAGRRADPRVRVSLIDAATGKLLREIPVEHWVAELAFDDDGSHLAILATEERLGSGPLETLGAMMGHGRPYEDFFVEVVDTSTGSMSETALAHDLPESRGRILWSPRCITSRTGFQYP